MPDAWVAPARQSTAPGQPGSLVEREWFVWRVPVSAVTQMLGAVGEKPCHSSDLFYSSGAFFVARLRLLKPSMQLCLYVGQRGKDQVIDVSLTILQELPGSSDDDDVEDSDGTDDGDRKIYGGKTLIVNGIGCGSKVCSPSTAQEFMPLLQEQLVDGHLVFKIKVHPI
eukprot:1144872-Pelagomonas_calceolata.AAC.3